MYNVEDGTAKLREIEAGVPQGSALGPLLWNITFDKVLRAPVENGCRVIAYADDIVVISAATTIERAKNRAYVQVSRTVTEIEELKLKVAKHKTETVTFTKGRSIPKTVSIQIGETRIQAKRSFKYLGVIIDDKMNYKEHIEYTKVKAQKMTRALGRLMPNLRGPEEHKRRLYANVLASVILYAAPVWAQWSLKKGKSQDTLRRLNRSIAQRVIAAYRTTSHDAVSLLARIPPYHLVAEMRRKAYLQIRQHKIERTWNKKEEKKIIQEEKVEMYKKWETYARRSNAAGKRTVEAILPIWNDWHERSFGNIGFRLTQLLTGHGVFYVYLYRIGKASTEICPHCGVEPDTAEHTLIVCSAWSTERQELISKLDINTQELTIPRLVREMIRDKNRWLAAQRFAERVMFSKEEKEREWEAEARLLSDSESRPSTPSSNES